MAFLPLSLMALAMMTVGCKTTESNYRQAYETAVAKTVIHPVSIQPSTPKSATAPAHPTLS